MPRGSWGLNPKKGVLAPGSDADIVMDPTIRKTLTKDDFHVADYSPWEGWQITGWPVLTILRGKVVAERGKLLGSTSDGRSAHAEDRQRDPGQAGGLGVRRRRAHSGGRGAMRLHEQAHAGR
jgi:hypothetical protein